MSEINDLKQLIKDNLDKRGVINKIKSEMKTEILSILTEQVQSDSQLTQKLSNENLLINDLIREYLDFNR